MSPQKSRLEQIFSRIFKKKLRYPASGGSEDWAKESAKIKFVYLLELRPDERSAGPEIL